MNGFLLLIPFLLIRFLLLSKLNKDAIRRAAYFPNIIGIEKVAYWIYQISNVIIFIHLCFLTVMIKLDSITIIGLLIYIWGLVLCTRSIIHFASPRTSGLNCSGIYTCSRNPMYVAYFVFFIGCSLLTHSLTLWIVVVIFQISVHWIILAEERWCIAQFGNDYSDYMKKVRRYI